MTPPAFVSGESAQGQCRKYVGTAQRAKALPGMGPLHLAADQRPEMTGGEVNVHGDDDHRCERVEYKAGQRKHKAIPPAALTSHLEAPNSSTVANGSTDHGRRRVSVNFVFCPGFTSTMT